jgi:quercetin dioxygenase-like cupin family protein
VPFRWSSTRSRRKTLAAPYHRHAREDEYSYVLEGRMGALLGDDVVYAEAGDLVYKPRNQWHTFWNAAITPCRNPRGSLR